MGFLDVVSLVAPSAPPAGGQKMTPTWREHGAAWASRNASTVGELDAQYVHRFGISRTTMTRNVLRLVDRGSWVLEVGSSRGVQLEVLARLGFRRDRMVGVDLSWGALTASRVPAAVADGLRLPFRDGSFDMVFTSGTLMHISPRLRPTFCQEMLRVTRRWVWGFELYGDEPERWEYQGLIPDAWALAEPVSFLALEPSLRVQHKAIHVTKEMPHVLYLLERL